MANPFCCRGKLGALPLMALGLAMVFSLHYTHSLLLRMREDNIGETSVNMRGAASQVQGLENRIKALSQVQIADRDVIREAQRHPSHLLDSVALRNVEQHRDNDEELLAADEGVIDSDALVMAAHVVDLEQGKVYERRDKFEESKRAELFDELVREPVRDGAFIPEDGMQVAGDAPEIGDQEVIKNMAEPEMAQPEIAQPEIAQPEIAPPEAPAIEGDTQLKKYVTLDLSVDGSSMDPMVFKMYIHEAPVTVKNFEAICDGFTNSSGHHVSYDNLTFHRIIHDFMMQGGQVGVTGDASIYGHQWDDESSALEVKHDKPGLLSMANAGPNTNSSQFFITFKETPHLDGRHAVFGEMVSGFDTLDFVNDMEIKNEQTNVPVVIETCSTHNHI